MHKRTASVGMLVFAEKNVLLVKHGQNARIPTGVYGLPSGRVEPGETEEQAAVRELYEETGLIADKNSLRQFPDNFYKSTLELKTGPEQFSWRVFLCTAYAGELRAGNEETTPEWVAVEKLHTLPLLPNIKSAVLAANKFSMHD